MSETSLSLLERIRRAPDESAWRRLVDLYAPLIRHWLRQAALQQADRDDLEQEVLAVMVRKLPEFQRERTGSFRAWLRVVCLNAVRAYFRSRRPAAADSQELSQLEDPNGALTKLWDAEHDRHIVRRLLELLEPQFEKATLQAFRGTVVEGRKASVVAAELGVSVNAVLLAKSRVLRCLRREVAGLID